MRGALLGAIGLLVVAGAAQLVTATLVDPSFGTNADANALFARGDFRGALARYRELQRQRPDLVVVTVNAASALYRLDEHARAFTEYDRGVPVAEGSVRATALYDRGNALFRLGHLDDARASYVEALKVEPTLGDAKFNIEVIDRIQEQVRQQQQGRPQSGQQAQPSGAPQQGQQTQGTQQSGQQQGGQSPRPGALPTSPEGTPAPSVNDALIEFRRNLTAEEALRLLDALRGEQRGVQTFFETGPQRRGTDPRY